MDTLSSAYYSAELQSGFNGFPVIRNVVEKYDPKSKAQLTAQFWGYRAKEDITALPPGYLVSPSQNVLHLASGLIYNRPGYTLDGSASTNPQIEDGIRSSYDWFTHLGFEQHIREHTGALEWRYVSPSGVVSWLPLLNQALMPLWTQGNNFFRYAEYWNTTEEVDELLFVNGDGYIYRWNGAQAAFATSTSSALSMNPFLASAEPGEVICITGPKGSTLTGTSSNASNYVLTATLSAPAGDVGVPVMLIVITTQPSPNDTFTITTANGTVTMTFVTPKNNSPLWAEGFGSGSIAIGYNYSVIGSGVAEMSVPNLSSPSFQQTLANLNTFLQNPGVTNAGFYVGNQVYATILSSLTINANPIITGSTTTAGNVVSSGGTNLTFAMNNNPANNDTITFVIHGQSVTFTFVSVIGTNPGNVLIGANAAATLTNLNTLINAPGTTTGNGVALSTENQYIISLFSGVISTGITLQGQQSWAELGFYTATTGRSVIIDGCSFQYTGGESTQTITGVTPDPTTTITINAGDPIIQAPMYCAWTSVTGTVTDFNPNLIAMLNNQIFYGNTTRRDFYMSAVNAFGTLTVNSPRLPGDGGTWTADSAVTGFVVQEQTMYAFAGKDWIYTVQIGPQVVNSVVISGATVSTTYEPISLNPLKISPGQGALSQEAVFKVKNSVFIITQEPAIDDLGRIADDLALPEAQTLTDSIKNDFLNYDLTGASGIYKNYFLYVLLPAESLMLVYNFFQAWWEPPQVVPFNRLALIEGDLYAHDMNTAQTYRFYIDNPLDPDAVWNDNGNPINSIAYFSYQNYGRRFEKKQFTELGVEGYIKSNTTLTCGAKYDLGGYSGEQTFSLSGAVQSNLVYTYADNSIGKVPLGKNPIGSITDSISNMPKFRHIFTMINIDFFEYQFFCQSNDVDQQWQLLAKSELLALSESGNNEIKT